MAQTYDFSMVRGDTKLLNITVTVNSIALDITGATIKATGKVSIDDVENLFQKSTSTVGVTITDAPNGKFSVEIQPADTASQEFPRAKQTKDLAYDIELTTTSGKKYTLVIGTITLVKDVTRT